MANPRAGYLACCQDAAGNLCGIMERGPATH